MDRATTSPSRPRILVVEDDSDTQHLMTRLLGERYEVSAAASGDDVLRQLEADGDVRVILMDVSLKGDEDGLSLTRRLRAGTRWSDVPIIAVTAHARQEDRARALAAGCDAYVCKPIRRQALLDLIETLLRASG